VEDGGSGQVGVHPVTRACVLIEAALDTTTQVDPMYLSAAAHRQALIDLTRLGDRIESLRMRVINTATAPGGIIETDGAKTAAAWLNTHTRSGYRTARAAEKLADALTT